MLSVTLQPLGDHSAPVTEVLLGVVEGAELSRCHPLDRYFGEHAVAPVGVATEKPSGEVGRVADLKRHRHLARPLRHRIAGDVVHRPQSDQVAVLHRRVEASADVDRIGSHVLPDYVPGTATQTKSFPLSNGVEPEALVLAQHLPRLQLHDRANPLSEMLPEEVVVVDPAEEADPLAVVSVGGD